MCGRVGKGGRVGSVTGKHGCTLVLWYGLTTLCCTLGVERKVSVTPKCSETSLSVTLTERPVTLRCREDCLRLVVLLQNRLPRGLLFMYPSVARWESLKMLPALLVGILMIVRLNVTVHLKRTLAVCSGTTSHLHNKKLKEKKDVSMVSKKRNMLCEVGESSGVSLVM